VLFLNKAHAGQQLVHTWFLEITFVWMCACLCMFVYAPKAINNYLFEIKPDKQVILFSGFYLCIAPAIDLFPGCGLSNEVHLEFLFKKARVSCIVA